MSEDSEDEETYQFRLSKAELDAFRQLQLNIEPYKAIMEKAILVEAENLEKDAEIEVIMDQNKQLADRIDEKELELSTSVNTCQQKEKDLNEVSKQLLEEKARVLAVKNLYREEIAKRRKLISEVTPTEQEINSELEKE